MKISEVRNHENGLMCEMANLYPDDTAIQYVMCQNKSTIEIKEKLGE